MVSCPLIDLASLHADVVDEEQIVEHGVELATLLAYSRCCRACCFAGCSVASRTIASAFF